MSRPLSDREMVIAALVDAKLRTTALSIEALSVLLVDVMTKYAHRPPVSSQEIADAINTLPEGQWETLFAELTVRLAREGLS